MTTLTRLLTLACIVAVVCLATGTAHAQSVAPVFHRLVSAAEIAPGVMRLEIAAAPDTEAMALVLGQRLYPVQREETPAGTLLYIDIPLPEPGFLTFRLRAGEMDSAPVSIAVRRAGMGETRTLRGYAQYQKLPVTESGLDTSRPVLLPIRHARVEVIDPATQQLLTVSETDNNGNFEVMVPENPGIAIRVLSQMRFHRLSVADNTNDGRIYSVSTVVDLRDPAVILMPVALVDRSSASGAFNIFETLQRANDLLFESAPGFIAPELTVYWSERNTRRAGNLRQGLIGTTHFDVQTSSAYVLGDRATDSDEFDDSVLLHEYAHFLAAHYSRDDSPGGPHTLGDLLDPRVAWSEGWANFFSASMLRNRFYRDTRGPNYGPGLQYDLEENVPNGDRPGYRSEATVHSLLWDLFDDAQDPGDQVYFPFAELWAAFTDLRAGSFVYLPSFLDRFVARNPEFADQLRIMAQIRGIDLQPSAAPSISNPFPKPIQPGGFVDGELDSFTPRRANLAQSAHFYSFTITRDSNVTIALQMVGLGPANNPAFNDLDLFLLDAKGNRLHQSDRGLNGQSEIIPMVRLAPGTYVIEVRSFYTRSETNTPVYNSGGYRLQLQAQ